MTLLEAGQDMLGYFPAFAWEVILGAGNRLAGNYWGFSGKNCQYPTPILGAETYFSK
jgi:hypothetical protein